MIRVTKLCGVILMFFVDLRLNVCCNVFWIVKSHIIIYHLLGSELQGAAATSSSGQILRYYICLRSASGSAPRWTRLEQLPKEVTRRHPDQMPEPPQVAPLNTEEQWLYFEDLPDVWAPHPISEAKPSHPVDEGWRLYLQPCSSNLAV